MPAPHLSLVPYGLATAVHAFLLNMTILWAIYSFHAIMWVSFLSFKSLFKVKRTSKLTKGETCSGMAWMTTAAKELGPLRHHWRKAKQAVLLDSIWANGNHQPSRCSAHRSASSFLSLASKEMMLNVGKKVYKATCFGLVGNSNNVNVTQQEDNKWLSKTYNHLCHQSRFKTV